MSTKRLGPIYTNRDKIDTILQLHPTLRRVLLRMVHGFNVRSHYGSECKQLLKVSVLSERECEHFRRQNPSISPFCL